MLSTWVAATVCSAWLARNNPRWWAVRTWSIRHRVAASTAAALELVGSRLALVQVLDFVWVCAGVVRAGVEALPPDKAVSSGTTLAPSAPTGSTSAATSTAPMYHPGFSTLPIRAQESLQKQELGVLWRSDAALIRPRRPAGGSRATMCVPLGGRPMAGHQVLVLRIGVRIPAPQLLSRAAHAPPGGAAHVRLRDEPH